MAPAGCTVAVTFFHSAGKPIFETAARFRIVCCRQIQMWNRLTPAESSTQTKDGHPHASIRWPPLFAREGATHPQPISYVLDSLSLEFKSQDISSRANADLSFWKRIILIRFCTSFTSFQSWCTQNVPRILSDGHLQSHLVITIHPTLFRARAGFPDEHQMLCIGEELVPPIRCLFRVECINSQLHIAIWYRNPAKPCILSASERLFQKAPSW